MPELLQNCSICNKTFHVQFSYQMEEHSKDQGTEFRFYCSQGCLSSSHTATDTVACSACSAAFRVTHASSVCYLRGRRNYACSTACREQLLAESNGARLGDMLATAPQRTNATAQKVSEPAQPTVARNEPATRGSDPVLPVNGPQVFAVFNHKGGTGKTTTAVTVAAGLAARGYRTLLADTDAQGNVGVSLGIKDAKLSLYHVLVMGAPVQDAVVNSRPNLDVLVANETLAAAELYLAGRRNRDRVLATRLQAARSIYDYVIVDCSPSLSLLNQNALVFSEAVLCPVACDYLSLIGVRQVVKTIKNVNRLLNHPVQLWGVLPTMYDKRAKICNEALETMREHFQERCLAPVRSAIRVKEAPSQGQTLFEYDQDSSVAQDYGRVVDRVIQTRAHFEPVLATA
jgi:chromosome partitioning protein